MSEVHTQGAFVAREPATLDNAYTITSFRAADAALRSPDVKQGLWDSPAARLTHDTITDLDAAPHFQRRRLESGLFSPEALACYEFKVLLPALRNSLEHAKAQANSEPVRADLMAVVRSTFIQVAAALVGIDGIDGPDAAEAFWKAFGPVRRGMRIQWNRADQRERARLLDRSFEAQDEYGRLFIEPSIARRRKLKESGEPVKRPDLISLMVYNELDHWDERQILREVTVFLSASIGTASYVSCRSFYELSRWLQTHPEDRAEVENWDFLMKIVNETARLYPPSPYVIRKAVRDTMILDQPVSEGQYIVVHLYEANRDPSVYGNDAAEFRPHRRFDSASRAQPFGLAFAGGPHMCIGKPLAVGAHAKTPADDAPAGLVGRVLRELVRSKVALDPEREPVIGPPGMHEEDSFPIIIGAERG